MIAFFGSQRGNSYIEMSGFRVYGVKCGKFRINAIGVETAIENKFTKRSRTVLSSTAFAALDLMHRIASNYYPI